ncbi:unnamed protein product [Adineta ricciae]|uniref:Uncharacterized protein n=1 Tax=Adineta ricciae TaxID=249248 RepID=A0A815X1Z6_ADIRI|nr:unnamed protein product [Adineta ricciae]CAF1552073.1 unnamed protein product [Adineta ricciae]
MNTVQHPDSDVPMNLEECIEHTNTAKYLSTHAYSKMVPSFKFIIENLIRIINDHDHRIGNQRALEFGDGPCLLTSFILAKKVQSIRFADRSLENLAAVRNWINQKPDAHDWSDLFDRAIHEYHTQTGDTSAKRSLWENRLREAIVNGGLLQFNVRAHDCPVLNGELNYYDIVSSSMCLERVCSTHLIYKQTIKQFYALLKENGFIILMHELNQSFYVENEHRHPILPLNRTVVIEALTDAGFEDIHDETQDQDVDNVADGNVIMIVTAFKPQQSS